jgi:two-component system sensor histidine kinase/response regulator
MKERVILCVDDEETILRSLKRELHDTLGRRYIIETATRGEEALHLFEELLTEGYEIPLVIVDQIMPGIKGDEVLKYIHTMSPKTLKIMLTGQADMNAVINALNSANLYRYIAKPWEKIDLAMTIKGAIQSYLQDKELEIQNIILRDTNKTLEVKVKERTAQLESQKTKLEQLNASLENQKSKLKQLTASLASQKVELKKLNASKDKFFSIIAHDLRAPFSGLLGITDFIIKNLENFSQSDIKEHLDSLREAAETVYTLLENLLSWSRLQRGTMKKQPEDIRLDEIAAQNMRLFASSAEQKQISLVNQIPEGTTAYADKHMIDTVMRNLLSNALKFTYTGGVISLLAHKNEKDVEFAISDTGTGIPQEDIPQLFQIDIKYSRAGTAGEEGTGLGLILCKDLIEKNGGTILVESEVGQGTTFTVRLPSEKKTT